MSLLSTIATFPAHGPIACRRCFGASTDETLTIGRWQAVNDPGAWGSAAPRILVLGFSKGFTQAGAYKTGKFENVPFKGMRPRLTEMLQALGLLQRGHAIDPTMRADEKDFAFGSLVRCSLARSNDDGRLECTGAVMPKAFSEEIASVTRGCAETYLTNLPSSVRLVLMLGTTDGYIKSCKKLIRSIHGSTYADINDVSYRAGGAIFVHVSHPSGLNGHHPKWMAGDMATPSGMKRKMAEAGVRAAMHAA
ncbi:hypothetical protein CCR94_07230 [Rhodoblastus sphagnicola]|uniref:Uracil-DNA glycosylase-like domain-containing protein n=1 Tax=Rhodoblastus sphagnicola TaxID=333368 RepID=A0A2S6NBM6_9HYPH|nr:hypothetical protein [Rhodoblastus sphagnicola]MBB4199647.1 hypothetical protein [Rhodoblastus sphagnicola]PPQ31994.1 hypothetical protein CCR94_07230 [Rhodoblastus sphagnicola]